MSKKKTTAFSLSQGWGAMNVATWPLPSHGRQRGEQSMWLHNLYFTVPQVRKNQRGCIIRAFSGSPKCGAINIAT